MRRAICLASILLLACGAGADSPVRPNQTGSERAAREADDQQAAGRRLLEIFRAGPGDPVGDARRNAARGDFRLIWAVAMGGTSPIGVACRFPERLPGTSQSPLMLAGRFYSDVIESCAERERRSPNACLIEQRMDAYAPVYNRAMVADPHFPYADLCDGMPALRPGERPSLSRPETLAAPHRTLTESPRNLGEAVRRGTPASVARLLGRPGSEIDRRDDFGLTPLAWAAIEHRADIASLLLSSGADPLAGRAALNNRGEAPPLIIALVTGQRDLADAMLTPAVARRLSPWRGWMFEAAIRGGHVALVRRMLREPHEPVNSTQLLGLAREHASPAMARAISDGVPDAAAAALEVAINGGDPVLLREALAARPSLAPGHGGRRSPLGEAIQHGGRQVDEMVRLLLAAGADPDSPAEWEGSYETGSTPPTALVALVALASRDYPGPRRPEPVRDEVMAAQRRALDLLLAAGASLRANDPHGRPLAVLAVTGRYGIGLRSQQELRPGWLTRLRRAGMDVNALWLGSTSLDWLDELGMRDTATARELEGLGGRRVKPADREGGRIALAR